MLAQVALISRGVWVTCHAALVFLFGSLHFAALGSAGHRLGDTNSISDGSYVRRHTMLGEVIGFIHHGQQASAECYLGIPFSKPPVNERRFKYPEPPEKWANVYNATYFRPWCIQFWYFDIHLEERMQSEDCLYLNVIVPHSTVHSKPYPVIVWIHGGSYQVGGARLFPIESTVRNLVSQGVIFVSINYRLGPIGFLSSIRSGLPGNYGLEDQIVALKWVKDNIIYFDGDPLKVTVCGESSGAASVGILATSPKTKNLFRYAVMRSGSVLSPWAIQSTNTDLNSGRLLEATNCNYNSDAKTLACLQHVSVDQMKNVWKTLADDDLKLIYSKLSHKPMNYNHPFLAHTYFTPVVDRYRESESIIPMQPEKMVAENARLPLMIGTTSGECIAYVSWLAFLAQNDRLDMKNIEYVAPSFRFKNAEQVKQAIYHYYFSQDAPISEANYSQTLIQIVTDQNIYVPAIKEMTLYRKKHLPIYAYQFDYVDENLQLKHLNFAIKNQGAAHGFDLVYLFQSMSVLDPRTIELRWNPMDQNITTYLAVTLTNFVKTGNPNGPVKSFERRISPYWSSFDVGWGKQMTIGRKNTLERVPLGLLYFWTKTIDIIQMLTMHHDYVFKTPPESLRCGGFADPFDVLNYRVAFFTLCSSMFLELEFQGVKAYITEELNNPSGSLKRVIKDEVCRALPVAAGQTIVLNRKEMLPLLFHLLTLSVTTNAQPSRLNGDSSPKLWALLVAGSNEWWNYRHQADICHAYQILHKHGVPDERIVVMMYDDIAYNKENIWKGKIINHPKGKDVYKGVPKDYTGKHVTPENFRNILLGLKEEVRGIGSEKVIDSGPNDHIFVNFVDHGAHGFVSFPTTEMTAGELNETLWLMHQRKRYGKMLIYVEACESGSMFHSTLPRDIEIYATTAANGQESSYACFYDETLKTYLGDCYSVNWMEDSDRANLDEETIEQQFKLVKKETNTSHVKQYGDLTVAALPLSEFFGNELLLGAAPKYSMGKFWRQDAVSSWDVPLEILKRRMASNSPHGRMVAFQYRHLLQKREYFHNFFKKLVLTMVDGSDVDPVLLFERRDVNITQLDCHTKMVHSFSELCFNFGKRKWNVVNCVNMMMYRSAHRSCIPKILNAKHQLHQQRTPLIEYVEQKWYTEQRICHCKQLSQSS
ncbi:hypothetical protein M514_09230 [Trichuris suis]|uniref:legumain n=1 Tax=Trichuris suis TaxID=68888 RepID=A0A085NLC5_9BILA|nr:hypothetical protein M514_09230 [Trichuris suis]